MPSCMIQYADKAVWVCLKLFGSRIGFDIPTKAIVALWARTNPKATRKISVRFSPRKLIDVSCIFFEFPKRVQMLDLGVIRPSLGLFKIDSEGKTPPPRKKLQKCIGLSPNRHPH